MIQLLLAIIILGQIFFWLGIKAEWTRKFIHFLSGISLIILPYIWGFGFALLIGVLFTMSFIFIDKKRLLKSLNVKRGGVGASLFPLGITLAILIGWSKPLAFQTAVLVLAISDTVAWFLGKGYDGKKRKKMIGISLLFGVTTFTIWLTVGYSMQLIDLNYVLASAVFTVILTMVEYYSNNGGDNLFLPTLTAAFGLIVF